MDFQVSEEAPFDRALVFSTHRDAFERIAPRMPEVESCRLKGETRHADGRIEQKHEWVSNPSVLPFFIRPLVPPEMLKWFGYTIWNEATFACEWRVEVPALGPMADIGGTQIYVETPQGCRIDLTGSFSFHPERQDRVKLPPGTAPMVERLVVSMIVPLFQKSGAEVIRYLGESGV